MTESAQAKGGRARAEKLSPEERKEIAQRAALQRWRKYDIPEGYVVPKAIASGILPLGEIPCAVLDDKDNTRVLTQSGFLRSLGRFPTPKSARSDDLAQLPPFLRARNLEPFISKGLITSSTPIIFDSGLGGSLAVGFRAQLLPEVCWVYQDAALKRALLPNQTHIAEACKVLLKGLTNVAIDALVDEASGFQDIRARDALIKLLEKYISAEAFPWVKTFDDEFYKEMFRLHGYAYYPGTVRRPMIFARRTEDLYNRLAPGARQELQRVVKRGPSGRPSERLFQHLTENDGYKSLLDLIRTAKIVMKLSKDPKDYERKMDRLHPRFGETIPLALEVD